MPVKNTSKEIHLHIPTIDIVHSIVSTHNFGWKYHDPYISWTRSSDRPDDNGMYRHPGDIVATSKKWFRDRRWELGHVNIFTWKDEVANKQIIAEIHIAAMGNPTAFEVLVKRLEKYVGEGRVLLSFWGDEPYVLR